MTIPTLGILEVLQQHLWHKKIQIEVVVHTNLGSQMHPNKIKSVGIRLISNFTILLLKKYSI
jgi:imidazoleglycerol phosphate synthase glutamine amidotransferase subunit HisH